MGYESEYHQTVHGYLHTPAIYERWASINRRRYFGSVRATDRVFEYGCGLGQNLYALPTTEKIGYDVSEYARAFARAKGVEVTGDLATVSAGAFDVAISRHVMEHLDAPLEHLVFLRTVLVPTGRLILILPEEPVRAIADYAPDVNNHLFSWTPRTLANLLFRAGFKVSSIRREATSGLQFFSPLAASFYPAFRAAVVVTDRFRRVEGEWVAMAQPADRS